MSDLPATRPNFPKALGGELLDNFSPSATCVAVGLISYWLMKILVGYLPLSSAWERSFPSIVAIGIFCFVLMSQRPALREAVYRWRYVAAFGIVFWLGTLYQAG